MNRALLLSLMVLACVCKSYSQNPKSIVLVGIMEDNREELINWKKGPSKGRVILPLFEKKGDEWELSTSHSQEIQWTIAFDGRDAGVIKSHPRVEPYMARIQAYAPEPKSGQVLTIGKPSEEFSGWENTLFNRPLVLVSNGRFNDPERWKRFQPSKDEIELLRSAFRKEYPKVTNCDTNEEPLPSPWHYKNSDIVVTSCYHSNRGYSLVNMFLKGGNCGVLDGPFIEQLFLFRPDNPATRINLGGSKPSLDNSDLDMFSLVLVDAGDYDGDGKSEVIFFVTGYNEDGYVMFYASFQKSVICTWHYH